MELSPSPRPASSRGTLSWSLDTPQARAASPQMAKDSAPLLRSSSQSATEEEELPPSAHVSALLRLPSVAATQQLSQP